MNRNVQVKICGVTTIEDAHACVVTGANMIGLNFFHQSPRAIDPDVARRIVDELPGNVRAVGVFVDARVNEVREIARRTKIRSLQLHGETSPKSCRELAQEFHIIRAFATGSSYQPETAALFSECDVLLDAHHPHLHGGTGLTCDWSTARATLRFTRFLILSGGLTPTNVNAAIVAVRPHAVDVCSGVESAPGVKNYEAIRNFIHAVRTH